MKKPQTKVLLEAVIDRTVWKELFAKEGTIVKKRLLIIGLVVLWMMSLCGCRHDMRIPTGLWYCAELDLTIWVPESWQESKIQNYDFPEDMVNNVAWVQNDRVQRLSATYSPTGPF